VKNRGRLDTFHERPGRRQGQRERTYRKFGRAKALGKTEQSKSTEKDENREKERRLVDYTKKKKKSGRNRTTKNRARFLFLFFIRRKQLESNNLKKAGVSKFGSSGR